MCIECTPWSWARSYNGPSGWSGLGQLANALSEPGDLAWRLASAALDAEPAGV